MTDPKTPQELRAKFQVIQGGLDANHVEPAHLSEEELRAEPVGQILQRVFDSYAAESPNFQMPDWDNMTPELRAEIEYMSSDPTADQFDFKRGPFLVDPEA